MDGRPVKSFNVGLHDQVSSLPERLKHTVEGREGAFEAIVPVNNIEGGISGGWVLQITADGYDPLMTPLYHVAESDKHLELQLQPGGTLGGIVLGPDGAPATGATFGIRQEGNGVVAHREGELSRPLPERTDAAGRFRFNKPLKAMSLVVFHETGWGVASLHPGRQELRIHLQPWGRIEGVLMQGGKALAKQPIGLHTLGFVAEDSLQLLCNTTTDNEGRFTFKHVPEGEFNLHWQPRWWTISGMPLLQTLERTVIVRSGETKRIGLGDTGVTVSARIEIPSVLASRGRSNILALLSQGQPTPPAPSPAQYATHASLNAAIRNHHRDPATLAARRLQRHFLGELTRDGNVVFQDVPPGQYHLEAKLFDFAPPKRNAFGDVPVLGQLRVSATVPDSEEPVDLGSFVLNPAN